MEEGFLSCLPSKKKRSSQQQLTLAGSTVPVYVIIRSFLSPNLPALQKFLQNHNLPHAFQDNTNVLKKLPKTFQDRFFIILNDFENDSCLSGEFENISYEYVTYSEQNQTAILNKYASFTHEIQKIHNSLIRKTQSNDKGETAFDKDSQEQAGQSQQNRSKIVLKCVSKIKHNYKSGWPKRLFIYSNRNDERNYQQYVHLLRSRQFKDTKFIEHIQQYLKQLPNKEDQIFAILMSQYSAINLRKYFKKSDEILLLAQNQEECMPLLRGKVTYLTALTETMDAFLTKEYDMKRKKQSKVSEEKEQKEQKEQSHVSSKHSVFEKQVSSSSLMKKSIINEKDKCRQSVLSLKISPQYSLANEPSKDLKLQSNIIAVSFVPQVSAIVASSTPAFLKKQSSQIIEPSVFVKQGIQKTCPLEVVHMERVSVLNLSHQSGISEQFSMFDEISNIQGSVQEWNRQQLYSKTSMKQNIVGNSGDNKNSQGSNFSLSSKASRNSRIFDRARERAKIKRKINFDNI